MQQTSRSRETYSTQTDPLVCKVEDILAVIQDWVKLDPDNNVTMLVARARADGSTVHGKLMAKLISGEMKYLSFSQSDHLLTALNQSYLFEPLGHIKVYRNPTFSSERFMRTMTTAGMDEKFAAEYPELDL